MPNRTWRQRWVVHSQSVGSGEPALRYLSRYVFKTATGERSLPLLPDGRLRWAYRESATGRPQRLDLEPCELIRRFLQHAAGPTAAAPARTRTSMSSKPSPTLPESTSRKTLRRRGVSPDSDLEPKRTATGPQRWLRLPTGRSPALDPLPRMPSQGSFHYASATSTEERVNTFRKERKRRKRAVFPAASFERGM